VQPVPDKDDRRMILATRVLEIIGTPDALALRRTLIGPPTGTIKPRNLQFFRRNFGGPAVQGKVGRE